jgi:hypothetical protein
MSLIVSLLGSLIALFVDFLILFLPCRFLYIVLFTSAYSELRKLKQEVKSRNAIASISRGSIACTTCGVFRYSSGKFETYKEPFSPFGYYEYSNFTVANLSEFERGWFIKRAHLWAQNRR